MYHRQAEEREREGTEEKRVREEQRVYTCMWSCRNATNHNLFIRYFIFLIEGFLPNVEKICHHGQTVRPVTESAGTVAWTTRWRCLPHDPLVATQRPQVP